ncbi:substrate-binding periplasmic protein [Azospirillum argentinense]|uniref:substrate-binding periplasmic protein n=1 Tax=Azospirillum argentinense TaxID=2970906 RepID=UPI00214F7951|nr:transporter substrate-binding domain-containing protein [Azospirillum argentinense]
MRACLAGVARLLVAALVLAPLIAVAPARAENWTVASEDYFPPYNFTERGKRTGMDTEIVDAMLKDIGVYPVHRPMAWPEVVRAHDENEVDVAFQFFTSPRRLERGHLVGPYRVGATVLMVRSNSEITYARIDDLQGLRIGVVDGFEYTPEFDKSPCSSGSTAAATSCPSAACFSAVSTPSPVISRCYDTWPTARAGRVR